MIATQMPMQHPLRRCNHKLYLSRVILHALHDIIDTLDGAGANTHYFM